MPPHLFGEAFGRSQPFGIGPQLGVEPVQEYVVRRVKLGLGRFEFPHGNAEVATLFLLPRGEEGFVDGAGLLRLPDVLSHHNRHPQAGAGEAEDSHESRQSGHGPPPAPLGAALNLLSSMGR